MTIRSYNDIEFTNKLLELAKLGNSHIGHLCTSQGFLDLQVTNRFKHPILFQRVAQKNTVSLIGKFFQVNDWRLKDCDLPALHKIAVYMESIGDRAVRTIYNSIRGKFILPHELVQTIAKTDPIFFALRACLIRIT